MAHYHSPSEEKWSIYIVKSTIPFLCCLGLILLSTSLPIFRELEGLPILISFIGIYYWSLNGKSYFHPTVVLALGIWLDLYTSLIIGLYSLLFLMCYMFCSYLRHRLWENSFLLVITGFVSFSFLITIIHIIITQMNHFHANIGQNFLSLMIASFFYVMMHGLFSILKHYL